MAFARGGQIDIRNLSAFSGGQRSVAIVLKVFCDGSGKCKESRCRFLTLAGMMATDDYWATFETAWRTVLADYEVPYSHMRELLGNKGPFEKWEDSTKRLFVGDLFNALGKLREGTLVASTLTIALDDYRSLAASATVKPAEAVCVDFVMTHAFGHPNFSEGKAEIFFDKDEDFIMYVERIWSRNKKNASSWASYVSMVAPADMEEVPPIQAADLLAWSANRQNTSKEEDFWETVCPISSILMVRSYGGVYGKAELMKRPGFYAWNSAV
jgi:hypothetical protein